MISLHT